VLTFRHLRDLGDPEEDHLVWRNIDSVLYRICNQDSMAVPHQLKRCMEQIADLLWISV